MRLPSAAFKSATTALLLLMGIALVGCGSQKLQSAWLKPSSTTSEGPDWWNLPSIHLDKLNGTVTIVNDDTSLYLRFYSRDRRLARRLERNGMTLWIANAENKTERVGIRYPLGTRAGVESSRAGHFLPIGDISPDAVAEMLNIDNDDLEIIGAKAVEHGRKSRDEAEQLGVHAVLTQTSDNGIEYTMRIAMGGIASWMKPGAQIELAVDSAPLNKWQFKDETISEEGTYLARKPSEGGFARAQQNGMAQNYDPHSSKIPLWSPIHYTFSILLAHGPAKS